MSGSSPSRGLLKLAVLEAAPSSVFVLSSGVGFAKVLHTRPYAVGAGLPTVVKSPLMVAVVLATSEASSVVNTGET